MEEKSTELGRGFFDVRIKYSMLKSRFRKPKNRIQDCNINFNKKTNKCPPWKICAWRPLNIDTHETPMQSTSKKNGSYLKS